MLLSSYNLSSYVALYIVVYNTIFYFSNIETNKTIIIQI